MPGPPKPRMKSSEKFSELERKIELLTTALISKDPLSSNGSDIQLATRNARELQTPTVSSTEASPENVHDTDSASDITQFRTPWHQTVNRAIIPPDDPSNNALIASQVGVDLFNHWQNNMSRYMPLTVFDITVTAEQARTTKPVTFLAIITIASSSLQPFLSTRFYTRFTHDIGQLIFNKNSVSIDIFIALTLFSHYYYHPEGSTNYVPTQYIHAIVAMADDLMLTPKARRLLDKVDDSAVESACACLWQWYTASTWSVLFCRPFIVQHSADLEKYAQILQIEPPHIDQWGHCSLKLQQILERASALIGASDSKGDTVFDEPNTQYKLGMLRRQLETWSKEVPVDVDDRLKKHGMHTAYLHIHEIAVRCFIRKMVIRMQRDDYHNVEEDETMGLSTPLFDCLIKCLESIKSTLDIYLSFDISMARCLPKKYVSWNVVAATILLKLSHFGEIVTKHQQQITNHHSSNTAIPQTFHAMTIYYLDAIALKMNQVCQDGYIPQAKSYITVLRKLKTYYLQKRAVCINPQGDAISLEQEEDRPDLPSHRALQHASCEEPIPKPKKTSSSDASRSSYHPHHHHDDGSQQSQQPPPQTGALSLPSMPWSSTSSTTTNSQAPPSINGSSFLPMTGNATSDPAAATLDQLDTPMMSNAYFNSDTYAQTDWDALNLDQDMVDQLDSYIFDEEDNAWMQSLIL